MTQILAAHCMYIHGSKVTKHGIKALYGGLDVSNLTDRIWIHQNISEIFMHPGYISEPLRKANTRGFDNDIAILETVDEFKFSNVVGKVCLPSFGTSVFNVEGNVVGYGLIESSLKPEKIPKLIKIPSVDQVSCFLHDIEYVKIASETTFCAGDPGKIPCRGDSGGGFYVSETKKFKIFGVVSSGILNNQYCDSSKYAIFTNVAAHLDWIQSILKCYSPQCESFDRCELVEGKPKCFGECYRTVFQALWFKASFYRKTKIRKHLRG